MYLEIAKQLLNEEYTAAHKESIPQSYQRAFIEEKLRHSYQVLGAGNYILRNEPIFANQAKKEIDFLKACVLLHDIARFKEILYKSKNIFIDHGVYGAEILSNIDIFNNIRITLPIKHHGHLIEELYQDTDYLNLTPTQQQDIKNISFLVRDADKLANFYLLSRSFENMEEIFFTSELSQDKKVSHEVSLCFQNKQSIKKSLCHTQADRALLILAWVFDIYYPSSFYFLQKLNILEKLFSKFDKFLIEKEYYQKIITDFTIKKLSAPKF